MIATVLQWVAVLAVGGASGAVVAVLVLRLDARRADCRAKNEIDDSYIDAMAKAWADETGRPWAARSVAGKVRILARVERARAMRRRS